MMNIIYAAHGVGTTTNVATQQRQQYQQQLHLPPLAQQPMDECEQAQDAALARDVGKKYARLRQFTMAKTYLESSLELYPLPGVARLLEHISAQEQIQIERATQEQEQYTIQSNPMQTQTATTTTTTAAAAVDAATYRERLRSAGAPDDVLAAVEIELEKIEAMDKILKSSSSSSSSSLVSDQEALAVEWLEWLVSLPWGTLPMMQVCLESLMRIDSSVFVVSIDRSICIYKYICIVTGYIDSDIRMSLRWTPSKKTDRL